MYRRTPRSTRTYTSLSYTTLFRSGSIVVTSSTTGGLSSTTSTASGVSTSTGGVSTSTGGVSTSTGGVSTSTGGVSASSGNASTSTGGVRDRKSTRLNSSHYCAPRMPSSA